MKKYPPTGSTHLTSTAMTILENPFVIYHFQFQFRKNHTKKNKFLILVSVQPNLFAVINTRNNSLNEDVRNLNVSIEYNKHKSSMSHNSWADCSKVYNVDLKHEMSNLGHGARGCLGVVHNTVQQDIYNNLMSSKFIIDKEKQSIKNFCGVKLRIPPP